MPIGMISIYNCHWGFDLLTKTKWCSYLNKSCSKKMVCRESIWCCLIKKGSGSFCLVINKFLVRTVHENVTLKGSIDLVACVVWALAMATSPCHWLVEDDAILLCSFASTLMSSTRFTTTVTKSLIYNACCCSILLLLPFFRPRELLSCTLCLSFAGGIFSNHISCMHLKTKCPIIS